MEAALFAYLHFPLSDPPRRKRHSEQHPRQSEDICPRRFLLIMQTAAETTADQKRQVNIRASRFSAKNSYNILSPPPPFIRRMYKKSFQPHLPSFRAVTAVRTKKHEYHHRGNKRCRHCAGDIRIPRSERCKLIYYQRYGVSKRALISYCKKSPPRRIHFFGYRVHCRKARSAQQVESEEGIRRRRSKNTAHIFP